MRFDEFKEKSLEAVLEHVQKLLSQHVCMNPLSDGDNCGDCIACEVAGSAVVLESRLIDLQADLSRKKAKARAEIAELDRKLRAELQVELAARKSRLDMGED